MGQLYVIKKSVEDFLSENVTSNKLEFTETLKEEIRYLTNENITKTYIIKSLTEDQATCHVKGTTIPKIYQQDTVIQKEVILKARPQEEITPPNNHNASKSLPNVNVHKSENNPSLKQNKQNVKKKTLIVGDSIIKRIDG